MTDKTPPETPVTMAQRFDRHVVNNMTAERRAIEERWKLVNRPEVTMERKNGN